ncbi:hypothetical protein KCU95_g6804, partial [Aureobasidium melanogenum]
MSFLSGFYNRLSGTFGRPAETEGDHVAGETAAQSDSANSNDASSRTLSPEDDQGDVNTPEKAPVSSRLRIPPTPSFAPPATPFAGQASPVVNQAAADQLMREAGASAPTPALKATPFFGVFAPPQTPATRNLSPVRNQAAEEQLRREMLGGVPETPATAQLNLRATPMIQKTPAVSHATPTEPLTELSVAPDALQTPSLMPSKRQHKDQSPIQEESDIIVEDIEEESQSSSAAAAEESEAEAEDSEASATSSPHAAVEMDLSEAEENNTSTTSIESSDSEKRRVMPIITSKSRRNQRRPNQRNTSKSYDDRRSRVQKTTRPGMGRSVSGREELLNRARKRFYDGKAGNNKLF